VSDLQPVQEKNILCKWRGNAIFNHLNASAMLEKTFGLFFYLKQAKNQKDGLRYVYLRITVDGKPVEMSTKQLWSPARWNVDAGRALAKKKTPARSTPIWTC